MCSLQSVLRQDNKGLCTLDDSSDMQEGGCETSVSLSLNGTLDSRRVQWHIIEQLWPFNCALITFMSGGRQQPQNNPPPFMNSPLGHCQSRPSPGILAAPRDPLLPVTPVRDGVGSFQNCHGPFCWGICLLSHVGHVGWKQEPSPSWVFLENSECWGG